MRHLACIMDGNRRWAKNHNFSTSITRASIKAIERVISFCIEREILYLSLYAFSLENLQRSSGEIALFFNTLVTQLEQLKDFFVEQKIAIRFIGDTSYFPKNVFDLCSDIELQTQEGTTLIVFVYVCYGGQQEIIAAAKQCAKDVADGLCCASDINADVFNRYLWTCDVIPPDVIVRTGGHKRLSNFLLYHAAYAELFFLDCLWPDITKHELGKVVDTFNNVARKFGK